MNSLKGKRFFEKEININYAKNKSLVLLNNQGKYTLKNNIKTENMNNKKFRTFNTNKKTKGNDFNNDNDIKIDSSSIELIPSNILFIKNINDNIGIELIQDVYQSFKGFKSCKIRPNYAIIEYESTEHAVEARSKTNNKKLTQDCIISVEYGV